MVLLILLLLLLLALVLVLKPLLLLLLLLLLLRLGGAPGTQHGMPPFCTRLVVGGVVNVVVVCHVWFTGHA